MAFALLEGGCRVVYCVDLPQTPGEDFQAAHKYAANLENKTGQGRLEYISADVTDQVRFHCSIYRLGLASLTIRGRRVESHVENWGRYRR